MNTLGWIVIGWAVLIALAMMFIKRAGDWGRGGNDTPDEEG